MTEITKSDCDTPFASARETGHYANDTLSKMKYQTGIQGTSNRSSRVIAMFSIPPSRQPEQLTSRDPPIGEDSPNSGGSHKEAGSDNPATESIAEPETILEPETPEQPQPVASPNPPANPEPVAGPVSYVATYNANVSRDPRRHWLPPQKITDATCYKNCPASIGKIVGNAFKGRMGPCVDDFMELKDFTVAEVDKYENHSITDLLRGHKHFMNYTIGELLKDMGDLDAGPAIGEIKSAIEKYNSKSH